APASPQGPAPPSWDGSSPAGPRLRRWRAATTGGSLPEPLDPTSPKSAEWPLSESCKGGKKGADLIGLNLPGTEFLVASGRLTLEKLGGIPLRRAKADVSFTLGVLGHPLSAEGALQSR